MPIFFIMANIKFFEIEGEVWLPIKGFEGLYMISSLARVRSLPGRYFKGNRTKPDILLKPASNREGYLSVKLYKNSMKTQKLIHRLVGDAFVPNPDNKKEFNHKDLNKLNNLPSNLEPNTRQENVEHAKVNGAILRGEQCPRSILTEKQVLEIFYNNGTIKEIAKKYSILTGMIRAVKSGQSWSWLTGKVFEKCYVRLSTEQIIEIYNATGTHDSIGRIFGVTREHVGRIKRGLLHREITGFCKK